MDNLEDLRDGIASHSEEQHMRVYDPIMVNKRERKWNPRRVDKSQLLGIAPYTVTIVYSRPEEAVTTLVGLALGLVATRRIR